MDNFKPVRFIRDVMTSDIYISWDGDDKNIIEVKAGTIGIYNPVNQRVRLEVDEEYPLWYPSGTYEEVE